MTAAALLLSAATALADPGPERVVFHTVAGDLVFALHPEAAPGTVKQFLRLVRAGVYDTTAFARIHPGFIAQVSTQRDRTLPLTPEQASLIKRLPLEASALRHVRGALSLARPDGDPDAGEFSFCVLLGPAPQLDGKYTVFGTLERGEEVLAEMLRVPRDAQMIPRVRLTIERAEVFDSPQALARAPLASAHPIAGMPAAESDSGPRQGVLAAGLLLMVLLACAGTLSRRRLSARLAHSLNLLVVLVGAFLLLVLLLPEAQHRPLLGALLFFGLVGVFRLLSRFETAAEG